MSPEKVWCDEVKTSYAVSIAQDANEVFAFLSQVSNETLWRQSIVGSRYLESDSPEIGVRGETDVQMGSKSLTMCWDITHFTAGQFVAWRLDGNPWNGGGSYRVQSEGDGCLVEASLEVRLKGAARVLEPLVGAQFRAGLRKDLKKLALYLDSKA